MNYDHIPQGDMPGDRIWIGEEQARKAETILPVLLEEMEQLEQAKTVVAVCGGSGVGKTGIASLLAYMLGEHDHQAYVLSGDNYPRRIPRENDAERLRVYETEGEDGLRAYLGSPKEIDFDRLQQIVDDFKDGETPIALKRMGREPGEIWYEEIDFSETDVLIIEWTHGNSDYLSGVDIPILLNSTPEETLEYRRSRNRDGGVDSPFTTMVLGMEQDMLRAQAHKAKIILTRQGELIDYEQYEKLMGEGNA